MLQLRQPLKRKPLLAEKAKRNQGARNDILQKSAKSTDSQKGWTISERVEILRAIEIIGSGGNQTGKFSDLPNKSEAIKTAGFGNERTARNGGG